MGRPVGPGTGPFQAPGRGGSLEIMVGNWQLELEYNALPWNSMKAEVPRTTKIKTRSLTSGSDCLTQTLSSSRALAWQILQLLLSLNPEGEDVLIGPT